MRGKPLDQERQSGGWVKPVTCDHVPVTDMNDPCRGPKTYGFKLSAGKAYYARKYKCRYCHLFFYGRFN